MSVQSFITSNPILGEIFHKPNNQNRLLVLLKIPQQYTNTRMKFRMWHSNANSLIFCWYHFWFYKCKQICSCCHNQNRCFLSKDHSEHPGFTLFTYFSHLKTDDNINESWSSPRRLTLTNSTFIKTEKYSHVNKCQNLWMNIKEQPPSPKTLFLKKD